MDLTLVVRFPHGRYHATPWDQAANSGVVEWPPSPWRLARALLSVWHTRHPEVEQVVIERLVATFGRPAEYRLPESSLGHTRHYMPLLDHKRDETGRTALTLDAYAGVRPEDSLSMTWREVDLTSDEVGVAAQLWASLPYLGRAESVCVAELVVDKPVPIEGQLWQPAAAGGSRLMCVAPGATLEQLETTPTQMRKSRSLVPKGSQWVEYAAAVGSPRRGFSPAPDPVIHAMRWRLVTSAPFPDSLGLWATDRLRWQTIQTLKGRDVPGAEALHGHRPGEVPTLHGHAHWLWTCADEAEGASASHQIQDLVVWVPDGVPSSLLTSMVGRRLTSPWWVPRGYVDGDLALVGFGGREVIDDLGANATAARWTSVTPFLMTRHMKAKRDFGELLLRDLESQLKYRMGADAPTVASVHVHAERSVEAGTFRQDRIGDGKRSGRGGEMSERDGHRKDNRSRPGGDRTDALFVTIELSEPVQGPLMLGRLSHFGFGRFTPLP